MGKKKSFTVSQVLDTHDIRNLPLMSLFISYAYGGLTLESADESSAVISISTTSSAPGLEAQLLLDFRTNAKGKIIAKTGTVPRRFSARKATTGSTAGPVTMSP